MTIDRFFRGCFDCGYEAAVILNSEGVWHISAYETGANVLESRYKAADGTSFDAALAAFESTPWGPSTKDAIADAQRLGDWK